jgi:hypothetical protein
VKAKTSHSLIALSTTALALPGIAIADAPPVESTLSYKISNYKEDDLDREESPFGDLGRYDIDVHQFQLITPIGRDFSLQIDANYEDLSGASPWFTTLGPDGSPVVNLSGASGIQDRRAELSIGSRYYLENGSIGGNIGYSEEDDYRATYGSLSGERHFNNDLTTVSIGMSYSADDIFPVDAEIFGRVVSENKSSTSAVINISQIINQVSTAQVALSVTQQAGFLTDPYKLRDTRPDEKTQIAVSTSYRRYIRSADAAWHVNYRYYDDDFGVSSQTIDMSWHQNLGRRFQLIPTLRYYSQSAANFFTNVDNFLRPETELQSSDYRLSAFGAVSGGLSFKANMGNWTTTLTAERYIANDKYSAHEVQLPSTALVKYFRVSAGVDFSF